MRDFIVHPIGFVRSPYAEKADAPRQGAANGAAATIEILPEHEHAVSDLEGFDRIWILFWFDRAEEGRGTGKVQPPRSDVKRGVFATRSPHRPNPVGMTAARLDRVERLVLHVRDIDILDGTPVIDIKPYIAYADAFPDARAGWLESASDPRPSWSVDFGERARAQVEFLSASGEPSLAARIRETLALGPAPHPYRRIRRDGDAFVLAIKEWRARFRVDEARKVIVVESLASGYRARELAAHPLHDEFMRRSW